MAILSRPVVTVPRTSTVMDAIRTMAEAQVGSVVVVDNGRLSGIFSERDVMLRVVLAKKDPERTLVEQVMTTGVQTIPVGTNGDEALRVMVEGHIRHDDDSTITPVICRGKDAAVPEREDGSMAGVVNDVEVRVAYGAPANSPSDCGYE